MNEPAVVIDETFSELAPMAQARTPPAQANNTAWSTALKVAGFIGISSILGFAFWLGSLDNRITSLDRLVNEKVTGVNTIIAGQTNLFNEKFGTLTGKLDRIEKDLDGLKEARYLPQARQIIKGSTTPKISFAPAREKETFNVSYPSSKKAGHPPLDVTFLIEEIGENFVKLKPDVSLRRGDSIMKLPEYPTVTIQRNKSLGINFLVDVEDKPGTHSGFAGKYVAVVIVAFLDRLSDNLVFASERSDPLS